jgi:hypothetical protein
MSQSIPQNLIPNDDPSLKDLLDLYKKFTLLDLNCHHIGQIEVFNPEDQTATISIAYSRTFLQPSSNENYVPVQVPYPPITCPVFVIGGGGGALTFPISPGDECLVAFNDRDIDNWFAGIGQGGAVNTGRLHSFTDAMCFVGFRSMANVLKSYDAANVVLMNGLTTFLKLTHTDATLVNTEMTTIGTDTILALIKTAEGGTLGAAFQTFLAAQIAVSSGPLSPLKPGYVALAAALELILA